MRGKGKVLGVVITLVSLVLAFYRVDYEGLFAGVSRANYALLVPALVLWLVGYLMRNGPLAGHSGPTPVVNI